MPSSVAELYKALVDRLAGDLSLLPDKPEESVESTVSALWHSAAGSALSPEASIERPLPQLDSQGLRTLENLIERRLSGVPLAHITGRQRFMGIEMLAGPGALVPRKETELLARAVVDIAKKLAEVQERITLMDVCTGSGNVALSAARFAPGIRAFAADLSEDAVALARSNAQHLGLADVVEFRCGDLLAPFDAPEFHGQVDILSCNPPYISSAKVPQMAAEISSHEPALAFDGGPFGVAIVMRLLQDAPRFLRAGGWLAFEVGLGQGPVVARRMEKAKVYTEIRELKDEKDAVRALVARLKAS